MSIRRGACAMVENARRAKTARGRRILAKREPKLVENPRTALIVRGQKTSAIVNSCLTDLFMLKKPHVRATAVCQTARAARIIVV